jgi:hypothetical protein
MGAQIAERPQAKAVILRIIDMGSTPVGYDFAVQTSVEALHDGNLTDAGRAAPGPAAKEPVS